MDGVYHNMDPYSASFSWCVNHSPYANRGSFFLQRETKGSR